MKYILYFVLPFTILTASFAQAQDNEELQKMADEDQKARFAAEIDWKVLRQQDTLRQVRVFELLAEDKVKTAQDYLNAGIIFQHGNDTVASGMAVECFDKAITLDSTLNRWWYAAAVDRNLMRKGEPQIYGTQYVANESTNGKMKLYDLDTTKITDKERQYYHVETLAEQKEKERLLNLKSISSFYAENSSVDEVVELIKTEFNQQNESEYNVSEGAINGFGYELMSSNKNEEALRIFKLNTELYPDGFNTYDSYGECLLKLNRREEGLEAYEKSLELNPDNGNAKRILSQNQ